MVTAHSALRNLIWITGLAFVSLTRTERVWAYEDYPVNTTLLQKHTSLYQELVKLEADEEQGEVGLDNLARRLSILQEISQKEPQWIDGLWMVADKAIGYGSSFTEEADLPKARVAFVTASDATEKCLKSQPNHPLCKFFLGAAIGKIATIDGIFASLNNGKRVYQLWMDVYNSNYNYKLSKASTLQGNVRYALGMYNRLVPDFFLLKWLFGVSGDKKEAVRFHREAVTMDGSTPCKDLMLAVAQLCYTEAQPEHPETGEALATLAQTKKAKSPHINEKVCIQYASKLESDPKQACGFTIARQQELDEEALKRQQESKKGSQ